MRRGVNGRGLLALMVVGFAVRVAYVLATTDHTLAGDEVSYDTQGRFIAEGRIL